MILISPEYEKLNRQLHNAPRGFGASGHRWDKEVWSIIQIFKVKTWLDYGCGQSKLMVKFRKFHRAVFDKIEYAEYDPCVRGKETMPDGVFDLVTCTDVLEHIEPKYLDNVICNIFSKARKIIFFNIAIHKANKVLPDGRNAHLIIEGAEWWIDRIKQNADWYVEEKVSDRPWKDLNLWCYPKLH